MEHGANSPVAYLGRRVDVVLQGDSREGMGTVLFAVNSRSEAVLLAPVKDALRDQGMQHVVARIATDGQPPSRAFGPGGVPATELLAVAATDTDVEHTAAVLAAAERALVAHRPALVVLAGDSNSALAFALAASKLGIDIARVGAGLRTGDFSQSQEINRMLLDRLANSLFTDTHEAVDTLVGEGIARTGVTHVGSTAVDALRRFADEARRRDVAASLELPPQGYLLAALHHAESAGDERRLARMIDALTGLAGRVPVVMPLHPQTRRLIDKLGVEHKLAASKVRLTRALGYVDFLSLEQSAGAVVTDSGLVQDETSALGVPCFTLRRTTERVMTLTHGTNVVLGDDPEEIEEIHFDGAAPVPSAIPLWDGRAGSRVADALTHRLTFDLAS